MTLLRRRLAFGLAAGAVVVGSMSACGGEPPESDDSGGSAGTAGASGTTQARLLLEDVFPAKAAANVSARRPFRLTFSAELDPASVEGAVRVQRGSTSWPVSLTVAGRELEIALDEIPELPARLTVSISSALRSTSGEAFRSDSWTYELPLWVRPTAELAGTPSLALAGAGANFDVLVRVAGDELSVGSFDGERWTEDDSGPPVGNADSVEVVGAASVDGALVVAWFEESGSSRRLLVARRDAEGWNLLGGDALTEGESATAALSVRPDGVVVVAFGTDGGSVEVHRYDEDAEAFEVVGTSEVPGGPARAVALATTGELYVLAFGDATGGISVRTSSGGAFTDAAARWMRASASAPPRLRLVSTGDIHFVGYLDVETYEKDGDEVRVSSHAHVLRVREGEARPVDGALDVDLDADASAIELALDRDENLSVGWIETRGAQKRAFVATLAPGSNLARDGFRVLGEAALPEFSGDPRALSLHLDQAGFPTLALGTSTGTFLAEFNGSPRLPVALAGRTERGSCRIPEDGSSTFPQTLAATGCYANLRTRQLVPAAIPYSVNSPLWSDGASKARYLLLPEGMTATFQTTGAFEVPVGTIVIKEFSLEATVGDPDSRFPVETRFLVKRCEEGDCESPWQGYSYRWNADGTNGELLEGALEQSWTVNDGGVSRSHVHVYPSRTQCLECHRVTSGRLLGINAPQLKRPHDYGGPVDSQLHAWTEWGLFGSSTDETSPERVVNRLPSPGDVSRTLSERTLAYFEGNCAHCHHPGGLPLTDFRYFGTGLVGGAQPDANLCDQLVPGDAANSTLYLRDSTRDPGALPSQMPPIATKLPDHRQLPLTAAWIDSLTSECEP